MGLKTDVGELAGLLCEGIFYGILVVLTLATLYVLLLRKRSQAINVPMVVTSLLMFTLATCQLAVDTTSVFNAFIDLDRPARIALLNTKTIPINAAKHAIFFAVMILGDAIVIYRCYIVWSSNIWIVCVPIIMSLTSGVLSYVTIWATQHPQAGANVLKNFQPFGTAIFSLSLAANVIATSLLAYRIWLSERLIIQQGVSRSHMGLRPVMRIVVESGALNTAFLITYMAVLDSKSPLSAGALPIVSDMATPFVGIVFSLVIVRVGWNPLRDSNMISALSGSGAATVPLAFIRHRHGEQMTSGIVVTTTNQQDDSLLELGQIGGKEDIDNPSLRN